MPLDPDTIDALAQELLRAEQENAPIGTLSGRYPDMDEVDAYAIAKARLRLRHHRTVGYKLGYTSQAMREQMNIAHPNYGVLTDDMLVEHGTILFDTLIHPLVEPEIAIWLEHDLAGGGHDRASVMRARPMFMPAIEVCDTRYREYKFKAVDNIADNSSAARYVLGAPQLLTGKETLRALAMELWIDDKLMDRGVGANALDDPLRAVVWLVNRLHADGISYRAGQVVLTGGLTRGYLVQRNQTIIAWLDGADALELRFR
ncbi:2-keto-4-pentenoate hydratase [Eoetvoesiella caeni]